MPAAPSPAEGRPPPVVGDGNSRVAGLDSIRFVAALWVLLGHAGLPPFETWLGLGGRLGRLVHSTEAVLVSGPAAVIVFFVISGYCIHHPFRDGRAPSTLRFYVRRFVRIGAPLVGIAPLAWTIGYRRSLFHDTILWSLAAEMLYYLFYPALRALRLRLGWMPLIVAAFAGAAAVVSTNPHALNYPSYETWQNALLGLPSWLCGCWLAEQPRVAAVPSRRVLWGWRLALWATTIVALILRFHSPIGYPITLPPMTLLIVAWLRREIRRAEEHAPPPRLERAGQWSYSLYLVHMPVLVLLGRVGDGGVGWTAAVTAAVAGSYLFYLVCERPSQRLAARLGSSLRAAPERRLAA